SCVIGSGVDATRFRPLPEEKALFRRKLGLRADAPVLLTVAALEERKGIQHALNALPAIRAAHPGVQYLVVGDGPYRPELERQVRAMGLEDTARLVGATSDVLPYYQAADLFVMLSHGEAAPLAPLEAM